MFRRMFADESGFIISSELVLVATLLVIGLIVGMSEVQHAVVAELNDVADAIGSANQSYSYSGFSKRDRGFGWGWGGVHAQTFGSVFIDVQDACDLNQCMLACNPGIPEAPKFGGFGGGFGGGYGYGGGGGTVVAPPARSIPVPVPVPVPDAAPCPGGCDNQPTPSPAPTPTPAEPT